MQRHEIVEAALRLSGSDVCAQILALSVVEFSYSPRNRISLQVGRTDGLLRDTGRGMRLTPDRGDTLSHAERALTSYYPCLPANDDIGSVLQELIWHEGGSIGPSLANFACAFYQFTSMRDGQVWRQRFEGGTPTGPAMLVGSSEQSGTAVEFKTLRTIDFGEVKHLADTLRTRIKGLSISLERA